MGKIIISRDGVVEQEVPLSRERMSIGRRSRNDIVLDHAAVSGEHAVITTILDESFLEDLRSTNGTFVNGQRVGKHFLQHQDSIKIAKYRIEYLADGVRPVPGAAPASEGATVPVAAPRRPAPAPLAAAAAMPQPAAVLGRIEVLNGANAGKQLPLTKPLTTLGRPGVQVIVISRAPDGYAVAQAEGEAIATVNGTPLGKQPQRLQDGDVLDLSGTQMAFKQDFA
ncbi:FHA domain-containing protein [Pseudoduganella aquatica]|uniref:FHA domain-containing protein n=1 Tax=Pseudoduganella aquatica TaxID=2660641 RepID=A0A7X4KKT3_9BURK|nr:FHA domain-containing protein [Pseudoduganella aquatica]MYN06447.1 FHA domain-containing protein [Pseudoduganella aquatica]